MSINIPSISVGYSPTDSTTPYSFYNKTDSNLLTIASQLSNTNILLETNRPDDNQNTEGRRLLLGAKHETSGIISLTFADTSNLSQPLLYASLCNIYTYSSVASFPNKVIIGSNPAYATAYAAAASNSNYNLAVTGSIDVLNGINIRNNLVVGGVVNASGVVISTTNTNVSVMSVGSISTPAIMVIKPDGKVGFGTTSPLSTIHTTGTLRVESNIYATKIEHVNDSDIYIALDSNPVKRKILMNSPNTEVVGVMEVNGALILNGNFTMCNTALTLDMINSTCNITVRSVNNCNIIYTESTIAAPIMVSDIKVTSGMSSTNYRALTITGKGQIGIGTNPNSNSILHVKQMGNQTLPTLAQFEGNNGSHVIVGSNAYLAVGVSSNYLPTNHLQVSKGDVDSFNVGYSNVSGSLVRLSYSTSNAVPFLLCSSNATPLTTIGSNGSIMLSCFTTDSGYNLRSSNAFINAVTTVQLKTPVGGDSNISCSNVNIIDINTISASYGYFTNLDAPNLAIAGFSPEGVNMTTISVNLKSLNQPIFLGSNQSYNINYSVISDGILRIDMDRTAYVNAGDLFYPFVMKTTSNNSYVKLEGRKVGMRMFIDTQLTNYFEISYSSNVGVMMTYQQDSIVPFKITRTGTRTVEIMENLRVRSANVSIDVAEPVHKFQVRGSMLIHGTTSSDPCLFVGADIADPTYYQKVGIKTATPLYDLHVNGVIFAIQSIVTSSDITYKRDLQPIENATGKIQQLTGYTYKRTDLPSTDSTKREVGLIAQDVLKVLPEAVLEASNGTYSLAYGNLAALFVESIKELKNEIDELRAEVAALKRQQ